MPSTVDQNCLERAVGHHQNRQNLADICHKPVQDDCITSSNLLSQTMPSRSLQLLSFRFLSNMQEYQHIVNKTKKYGVPVILLLIASEATNLLYMAAWIGVSLQHTTSSIFTGRYFVSSVDVLRIMHLFTMLASSSNLACPIF